MRKAISVLITLILLFNSFPCTFAAAEVDGDTIPPRNLTYEELLAIAFLAFPEHENIQNVESRSASNAQGDQLGTLVSSETRKISNSQEITYLEYSSGYSLYTYQVDWLINSSASGTGYSTVNTDIYVYSPVLGGMLQVHEFSYTHVQYGYDVISSTGRLGSNISQSYLGRYKLNEDENGPAYAYYTGVLENYILSQNVVIVLAVYVGNNNRTYEVYG